MTLNNVTSLFTKQDNETSGNVEKNQLEPHNIEAEQAILGNLLDNNEAFHKIDFLLVEHFYIDLHKQIFQAIVDLHNRRLIASTVTLKSFFANDSKFQEVGGDEYLENLVNSSSIMVNIGAYAKLIFDLYQKRQLKDIGVELVNDVVASNQTEEAKSFIERTEQSLFKLANQGNNNTGFHDLSLSLNKSLENVHKSLNNEFNGLATNLKDFDKLLGGLQNSDLLILAGRPSMGKTALAINMAVNIAQNFSKNNENKSVGFFSLEMSEEQLASRIISMESTVNAKKFRSGNFTGNEFSEIVKAVNDLHKLSFFIDETPALSISAIRTRARRLKRQNNLGILFVDYLQLATSKNKADNRVQEISDISQGLKALAKELDIPVIALSQLSRAVESRDSKKPQLSDLRESGSIEQDADVVMFIYREEYYLERKKPTKEGKEMDKWLESMNGVMNQTEIIIAKQRHGPIGTAKMYFDANTTKFKDLAENY